MSFKVFAVGLLAGLSFSAAAQEFPQRPIRLILGVAPGGGQETIIRGMSPKLLKTLGVNLIVDNRPGGSGAIAVEIARQATPDGYTLLMISASQILNPLVSGATYDRLNGAFVTVIDDPEMAEHFAKDGAEGASSTPQQFAAFLKSEQSRWARLIKNAGLQAK